MRVGIAAQKSNSRVVYLAAETDETLVGVDVEAIVDAATAEELDVEDMPVRSPNDRDLMVSIGDSGTFLCAARGVDGVSIPGINLGEVGFLSAASSADTIDEVLAEVAVLREGDRSVREVPRIVTDSDSWKMDSSMGEVVVHGSRRGHGDGADPEVRVDGSLYSGNHIDDVLATTLAGSSTYNLNKGGPFAHLGIEGLTVTEMAADEGTLSLIIPQGAAMSVTAAGAASAVVVGDGRTRWMVPPSMETRIERSDLLVRLAGPTSDFLEALDKLN